MAAVMAVADPLTVLSKELECAICKDLYKNAKILSCKHCFCLECIEKLSSRASTGFGIPFGASRTLDVSLTCPICKKSTIVPGGCYNNLESNKLANDMVAKIHEIEAERTRKLLCQEADCKQDSKQKATSYCESCKVAICGNCGMRNHRDPQKHLVLSFDEAVTKRSAVLRENLDWGTDVLTSIQADKTAQKQTLDKCFDDKKGEINSAFIRTRRELERKEMKIKTKLCEIKNYFESALKSESERNAEAVCSIEKLNQTAKDYLCHGREQMLLDKCETLCNDYSHNKETLSNTPNTDSCITKLKSNVVFERSPETFQAGVIKYVREWPMQHFPLDGNNGTTKPSSLITLQDKKIVVGFHDKPNGKVYEWSGKFSHTVGSEPMKDMALLTKDTIIVLNNRGDFVAHQFNQSKWTKTVLKTHDANTAAPNSVAIDHNGNILLLNLNHLDSLSKDGSPLGTISLDLKHQPSQLRVGQSPDGRTTVVLLRDGETLRLLHLDLSEKKIVEERHLPYHRPDTRLFGTLDREGHCFIAEVRNKGSVTISKYEADFFSYCEVIATDLEAEVGEDESIILSAPDPTCLILCTPREIYVLSEKDGDESSSL